MTSPSLPFRPPPDQVRETERLVAAHLLVPVLLDVVVAAGTLVDRALRADALRLVVPERLRDRGAVVVERAAAWFWAGGAPPDAVDVAVVPGSGRAPADHVVRHERRMPPDDGVPVLGRSGGTLLVSTPERTVVDVLRTLPMPGADRLAQAVVAATGADPADVAACLGRLHRARGVARARVLLARWESSPPEPGAREVPAGQSIRLPVTR